MLFAALSVRGVYAGVARQGNILLNEDILNLADVNVANAYAVSNCNSCCNTCCLTGTYALGMRVSQSIATSSAEMCLPGQRRFSTSLGRIAR